MKHTPPHLKVLEEIEREGIPGLVEVLREEGIDAVRYVLWAIRLVAVRAAIGWHRDYSPPAWRNRITAEPGFYSLNPAPLPLHSGESLE